MGIFSGLKDYAKNQTQQPQGNKSSGSGVSGFSGMVSGNTSSRSSGSSGFSGMVRTASGGQQRMPDDGMTVRMPEPTSYQKNMAKRTAQKPQEITFRNVLGRLYDYGEKDAAGAESLAEQFGNELATPGSRFFFPYAQATNKAVGNLESYGFNMRGGATPEEILQTGAGYKKYMRTTGYTNNFAAPTKKSSDDERIGYEFWQYELAEDETAKAEQQRAAIEEEISYLVGRTDLNLSNDQIADMVYGDNFKTKYKTLYDMDEGRMKGTPLELNRPVMWCGKDSIYGMIYAARNNGGTGNHFLDMAYADLGRGNVWQDNPEITAKLTKGAESYSPFSVASTMNDELMYFGTDHFDSNWLEENEWMLESGDETMVQMYYNVQEGEAFTQAAESELATMQAKIDRKLGSKGATPENVGKYMQDLLDSGDYPSLARMQKAIDNRGDGLPKTTRKIAFSKYDMMAYITEKCGANSEKKTGDDLLEENSLPTANTKAPAQEETAPEASSAETEASATAEEPAGKKEAAGAHDNFGIKGRTGEGNIDLFNRKPYVYEDGSVATVESISFRDEDEGKEILIPTIVDGKRLTEDEAIEHYYNSGEYLGKFDTVEEANEYGERLHRQQEALYSHADQDRPGPEPTTTKNTEEFNQQQDQTRNNWTVTDIQDEADRLLRESQGASLKPSRGVPANRLLAKVDAGTMSDVPMTTPAPTASEEQRREAYDAKYGTGAYDREVAGARDREQQQQQSGPATTPSPTPSPDATAQAPKEKTGQQRIEDSQNSKVSDATLALESGMTMADKMYFSKNPGVEYGRVRESMLHGPLNPELWQDPNYVQHMTGKQQQKAEQNYIATAFDSMSMRTEYENRAARISDLETQINSIWETYGDRLYAREEIPDSIDVNIPGLDQEITIFYDSETGTYEAPEMTVFMENYLASRGITTEEYLRQVDETVSNANQYASRIMAARESFGGNIPDDMPSLADVNDMTETLTRLQQQQADAQDGYDQANADLSSAGERNMRMNDIAMRNGGEVTDRYAIDTTLEYVKGFYGYESPPAAVQGSLFSQLATRYVDLGGDIVESQREETIRQSESERIAALDEYIADADFALTLFGDNMPEDYRAAIESYKGDLESQKRQYGYYDLYRSENFKDLAARGLQLVNLSDGIVDSNVMTAEEKSQIAHLTAQTEMLNFAEDYERDMFYAILAGDGQHPNVEGAWQYYQDVAPGIQARTDDTIRQNTEEMAQEWYGRLLNTGVGIALAPVEVIASGLNLISMAAGNESSYTLNLAGNMSKTAYGATVKALDDTYGDGPQGKIIKGLYEIAYNRGRSAMVGSAFGGMFPEGTSDIVHAMPIALTAMNDTVTQAINAGVEPWKAWTMGAATFLSESVTEGIEFGHMDKAFKDGFQAISTVDAFKDFFKSYIPSAMSEVVGESVNDILENAADIYLAGDKGEYAAMVQSYVDQGYLPEMAEELATRDQINGIFHTAVISFFSPGMDVLQIAGGQLKSYADYHQMAVEQSALTGERVTVRDLRKANSLKVRGEQAAAEQREQIDLSRPMKPLFSEERAERMRQENAAIESMTVDEQTQQSQTEAYDIDMTVLDGLDGENVDSTAETSTVSAVLQTANGDANAAGAAAVGMETVMGESYISKMQSLLAGGMVEGVDIDTLKQGMQYAALADGESRRVLQSPAFAGSTPAQQARMLALAAGLDAQSEDANQQVATAVHEFRVAETMKEMMANGAGDAAVQAEQDITDAKRDTTRARETLETHKAETRAANEAVEAATQAMLENPEEGEGALGTALEKAEGAAAVEQEYEQKVAGAERNQEKVENTARKTISDTMTGLRQQAEQDVAEQEAQEAQARQEELDRKQADIAEQERLQAEEDERTGKADEDRADTLIENYLDSQRLEGAERDNEKARLMDMRDRIKLGKIDMSNKLDNAEGILAIGAFGRKLGLSFELSDTLGSARGMYENGKVYLNNSLIKNGQMTVGQALVEASLHEITHSMENTKHYKSYRNTVLSALFGDGSTGSTQELYDSNADFRAAVDQKIAEYSESVGQDLSIEAAEKEIVADFARTRLNERDVVMRFLDNGLGGKMRNTLHNINQALKNFRLRGEEKIKAEYLRRAERAFQKAMDDVAKSEVHPEGGQFSVVQFAQAAGMDFNPDTLQLYDAQGREIDGVNNKVTTDMMAQTPVGMLINNGLSEEQRGPAMDMMAGLMNMVARYKDSNLVWEIGASTLSSTFSALKSNSDPQYATTVDFGTVCAKTQAIIDVMSQVMLDRVKEGKTGGLTRDEIMKVYNETHNAGLSVPCPVCYVFSRWMGVPSLLGQMSQFQNDYVVKNEDGSINTEATQAKADEYIRNAEEKYGDAKKVNNAKAKLQAQLAKLGEQLDLTTDKSERDSIVRRMTEIDDQLTEVNAYNWITQALCKKNKDGSYTVDPKFKITPDEILFDLNRTGEFAGYEKNWRYRNTRGAGMGKAIMPYSGETIGDILYGVKSNGRQSNIKNPWLNMDEKAAARQLKNAQERARKQNLVGGQRLQSTSDFRPEWGLDYIMSFLELQAAGSKVQMYTKVPEAVDFLTSVGADVNMSIMAKNNGFHEASAEEIAGMTEEQREAATIDGKVYVMDFSSITGMDYETAKGLKNKHDRAQMILVGMNDTHIRLAMKNSDIDFIIPWHSSGNSQDTLKKLIGSVGEKLITGTDYSTTQTDSASADRTPEQKALWDARVKLLTKGGNALTLEERTALLNNPYTADLYKRFTQKGVDPDCYGVKLNKAQAEQIFPYEYWDTTLTKDQADQNGKRFVEYCEAMGIVPRFSQFKDDPGYWKLLIDRPMYNNDGSYHQQQVIDVTNARIGALDEGGKLTDSDLPTSAQAKYASKDPRSDKYGEYTEREQRAIENSKAILDQQYDDGSDGQYSVFGDMTDADMEQMMGQAEGGYQDVAEFDDAESSEADSNQAIYHQNPEYMKPFAEQLHDFAPKETRKAIFGSDSLLVGGTPELLKKIGFPSLPVVINQQHVGYALDGNYPNPKYRAGHIFSEEELSKLPEKIADPVAITYSPKKEKNKFNIYVDMVNTEGDKVLVPLEVGAARNIGGRENVSNVLRTVFEQEDGTDILLGAIKNDSETDQRLFYLNKEKALSLEFPYDKITIVENAPSGINHIINAEGSLVNTDVKSQTDTPQFKSWFGNSKVVNPDKSPMVVYHGSNANERFSVFKPGERGEMWFSSSEETAYNKRPQMYKEYLKIENPYEETNYIGTNSKFDPVRVTEEGRANGHDGSIVHWRLDPKLAENAIHTMEAANLTDILATDGFNKNFSFLPHGDQMKALAREGETLVDFMKRGMSEDLYQWFAVSDPTQIKSATDNIGLFDTRNPDIRYSAGGESTDADAVQQLISMGAITQEDVDAYNGVSLPPTGGEGETSLPGTPGMGPQRQFGHQTAQDSDALHQEVRDYLYSHSTYTPDTNQAQIDRAMDWVQQQANDADPDGYRNAVNEVTSENFDYRSADGQARMLTVMGMAALKGDVETELRLADAYNAQGTDLGRQLQARKIFRLMTPIGRISHFQKQVDNLNREIGRKTGRTGTIKLDDWTVRAIGAAENEADFEKVRQTVAKEIGEQIPANWKDKLNAWRMLAMLGNPRTHIRNIVGNALFIPAVSIKNKLGAVAELGLEKGQRTKTLAPAVSKEIRDFARQDAVAMKDTLTGEAKYNEEDLIQQNRRIFRLGLLQTLSDFNSNALEGEDWFFLKGHYRRALGGWMQANGYTAEQMRNDPALLEHGRTYAVQEAQKATYRDFNGLAKRLNDLTRNPETTGQKVLAFGMNAVLPFKKTPANILKRGIEYSPVGIARALTTDLRGLKQYQDYQNGKLNALPDSAVSPNEFIDHVCSGLTGTGIMAMGAILGSMGVVSCGLDGDDDDEFEKLRGNQEYAIKFSIGGQDVTFTMDWAAPMSMPFFVGAAIWEQHQAEGGMDPDSLINAFGNITEPVFNLSMLDGVNSLVDMFTSGQDTNATLTQLGAKVAANYATSYIPSILGATARTVDTTRRKAYVESGKGSGIMGTFRYAREQVENKIPGLSQTNIPYRDVWGNAEESGLGERILENFVLPGYINQYRDDPVVGELQRIGIVPKDAGKTFNAGGSKYVLTDKQYDAYKTTRGQTAYNTLNEMMNTDYYQSSDPDTKRALVEGVWDYANNRGKLAVDPNIEVDEWVRDGSNPVQEIIDGSEAKAKKNRITTNKGNMITALSQGDIEGYETMVEALREDGVDDKTIKNKIADTYRDQYKDAYRNGDYSEMERIETLLSNTDFDFDTYSWEKAVDKETN